ncbi:MAG: hypothetical protein JST51_04070 [Armatimonadetes bacterium]|nr:hypothetical protein [Armatimonadota bacterium]
MTALIAALVLGAQPAQGMKSTDILAKVLQKYADANSGVGEITMTQIAGTKKISIKTDLQYVRPSKLFIHQSSTNVPPNDWLVVSDGTNFGYDAPRTGDAPRKRLFEPVAVAELATGSKRLLKDHSIYMAAKRSLGDTLNPYIEFATQAAGDNQSLQGFMTRMIRINQNPTEKDLDGASVYDVSGTMGFGDPVLDPDGKQMIDKASGLPMFDGAGRFNLYITKDFEIAGMRTTETVQVNNAATNLPEQIIVITSWSGKVKLNETPADTIFTVK